MPNQLKKQALEILNLTNPHLINQTMISTKQGDYDEFLLDKEELSGSDFDSELLDAQDEDLVLGVWTWNING